MTEMQWIKLRIDMFDDEKIKIIQAMPEGDTILVVWIRLIALAGKCNANGLVVVEDEFPYTDEMLSIIFGKPLQTVKLALATFEKFRMIENTTKGIYVTNLEKHQNIDGMDKIREQNRIRKQRERERKNALLLETSSCNISAHSDDITVETKIVTDNVTGQSRDVTQQTNDKSRDVTQQNKRKKKNKNNIISISSDENIDIVGSAPTEPKRENLKHEQIKRDFNATCQDLPEVKAMSETRKRDIRTLLNEFEKLKILDGLTPYEKLHRIFLMVQDSDFLSGRNGKWNKCSFDWIINKRNALKILEGNYANKADNGIPPEKQSAEKGAVQKEQENPEEEEEVGDDWLDV